MRAAQLLRQARQDAGLTLRQLSEASGVAESRISDYEHGRHEPSVAMLQRLLGATGHELVTAQVRPPAPELERRGRALADVLTLVDAMPLSRLRERSGRSKPEPPTWTQLLRGDQEAG